MLSHHPPIAQRMGLDMDRNHFPITESPQQKDMMQASIILEAHNPFANCVMRLVTRRLSVSRDFKRIFLALKMMEGSCHDKFPWQTTFNKDKLHISSILNGI